MRPVGSDHVVVAYRWRDRGCQAAGDDEGLVRRGCRLREKR